MNWKVNFMLKAFQNLFYSVTSFAVVQEMTTIFVVNMTSQGNSHMRPLLRIIMHRLDFYELSNDGQVFNSFWPAISRCSKLVDSKS